MKQPKKPTRNQKELMAANGLVPDNWQVVSESKTDMEIVSKRSKMRKVLQKQGKQSRGRYSKRRQKQGEKENTVRDVDMH